MEIQFNWIFVLIIGSLILVFFFGIANVQRDAADKKLAYDVLSRLDLIMSGALTIPKAGQVFEMPALDFNFDCNSLGTLGVTNQFAGRIVFSPDVLHGRRLITWSQDWNAPFKVANFLYLTTTDVKYVFVNSSSADQFELARIFDELPSNMTKVVVGGMMIDGTRKTIDESLSELTDSNNYKIRLVFFEGISSGTPLPNNFLSAMDDSGVTAVAINSEITFLKKNNNNLVSTSNDVMPYLKDPLVFGAIFTENAEMYNCSLQKAFTKLHFASQVYLERENSLLSFYEGNPDCGQTTTRAPDLMQNLIDNSKEIDIPAIESDLQILAGRNAFAIEKSCPAIY